MTNDRCILIGIELSVEYHLKTTKHSRAIPYCKIVLLMLICVRYGHQVTAILCDLACLY